MKSFIKNNIKFIIVIIICLVGSSITTLATNYLFNSNEVSYDNTNSGLHADYVQGAIDEVFQHATDYSEIKTKIGSDTLTTTSNTLIGSINELNSNKADLLVVSGASSYAYNSQVGAEYVYNNLPTNYKGMFKTVFSQSWTAYGIANKTGTTGTIEYFVDGVIDTFVYKNYSGSVLFDKLALNSNVGQKLLYKQVTLTKETLGTSWTQASRRIGDAISLFGVPTSKIVSIIGRNANFSPSAIGTYGFYDNSFYVAATQTTTLSTSIVFDILYLP